jgi:N-acetylmuramoyl-L-alanine amidase
MTTKKIITIDPGHGPLDNKSPNNPKYIEGVQMFHLANKLKAELEAYGFGVVVTRQSVNNNPSLETRGGTAGKNGSILMLSLHSNAPGANKDGTYDKSITGSVVYYSVTRADNKTLADALGKKVAEVMGHYYRGSLTKERAGMPGVDYYGVIRHAAQSGCKCAMLVEHGFHTNPKDSNFLLSDANLQKLAEAEAAVIADYFGQTKKSEKVEDSGTIYRLQLGAWHNRGLAEAKLAEVKAKGFKDAFIVEATKPAAPTPEPTIKKGSTVRVNKGAKTYTGGGLASFVYERTYTVSQVDGDRVVITDGPGGTIVAAVRASDLTLIK